VLGALFWLYQLARQFSSFGSICIKPTLIADEFSLHRDSDQHLFFGPGLASAAVEGSLALSFKARGTGPAIKANEMQSLESVLEPLRLNPDP